MNAKHFFIFLIVTRVHADVGTLLQDMDADIDLETLLVNLMNDLTHDRDITCFVIICDTVYLNVFEGALFKRVTATPYIMIVVDEYEDLLSPNYDTLQSIRQARRDGCNAYIILLANGLQTARLVKFGDRHRIIDTRAKYIILHDFRLFGSEMHYIWKRVVNVVFLRHHGQVQEGRKLIPWFDLTTVPFPSPIKNVLVPKRLDTWRNGRFYKNTPLFADKTSDLKGQVLNVVYLEHVPAVTPLSTGTGTIRGIEIEVHLHIVFKGNHTARVCLKPADATLSLCPDRSQEDFRKELGWLESVMCLKSVMCFMGEMLIHIIIGKNSKVVAIQTGQFISNSPFNAYVTEFHNVKLFQTQFNSVTKLSNILYTLAKIMNFEPHLYEPMNARMHRWGQKQINGSFSGLLGEMVNGKADVALGNLQYTPYHLQLTDLTIPYISQCWTFLTPEALTDNSWKTLILPFKLSMWIAVLLMLFITGVIFYCLANYHIRMQNFYTHDEPSKIDQLALFKSNSADFIEPPHEFDDIEPRGLYLFSELINSILYTYGMLLVVSLPKLPTGWSVRLLTGWYWLYCILLVVSYRASMTAILANPAPRVTIDTLSELVDSKITCGGWGTETKKFFLNSLDEPSQIIGERFEVTNDPDEAVRKVAKGIYAYYDNEYFLKYISVKRQNLIINNKDIDANNSTQNETDLKEATGGERNLHIMTDCIVNIPISLGLQKNSPLKPLSDKYLRRIIEVGLVEKWLTDAMQQIRTAEIANKDEVKALMNLKKLYGAFVALGIGYFLATVCLIAELIQWHCVTKKDPAFDKYAMDLYYSRKHSQKKN